MARSFVIGGTSATGIATGVPYIRRVVRQRPAASSHVRHDNLSAQITGHKALNDINGVAFDAYLDGKILNYNSWFHTDDGFHHPLAPAGTTFSNEMNSARNSRAWNADISPLANTIFLSPYGWPGEMMHIEFPATTRTFSVQFEAANYSLVDNLGNPAPAGPVNREHRLKVMLTCPAQRVVQLDDRGNPLLDDSGNKVSKIMDPLRKGNYIEIAEGETATFNVRTNHFFIFLSTFDTNNIFDDDLSGDLEGLDASRFTADSVSFLVTAILEHDGQQSRYGTATKVIGSDGQEQEPIKKIYPQSVNIDNNSSGVG